MGRLKSSLGSRPQDADEDSSSSRIRAQTLVGVRCLVVEDDPIVCTAYARVLEQRGANVVFAHTLSAALHELRVAPFDVAIIDIGLRGEDGRALIGAARERGVAVCVVSALWDDESRAEVERIGVLTLDKAEVSRHLTEIAALAARALESRCAGVPLAKARPPGEPSTLADDGAVDSLEPELRRRLTEFADMHRLTEREHAVLVGRVAGLNDEELAARLGISRDTVGTHRRNAARKAGVAWVDLVLRFAREVYRKPA